MANFTTNENLYKWSPTDTKTETITEMAKNADKIDAKFIEVDTALDEKATNIRVEATEITLTEVEQNFTSLEGTTNTKIIDIESVANEANAKSDSAILQASNIIANAGDSNTEIVDARLRSDGTIAVNVGTHLREVSAQLAENARVTNSSTVDKKNYVTFYFDDAPTTDITRILPVTKAKGIAVNIAKITGQGGLTDADLLMLQNQEGWEIDSHTVNHADLPTLTESQLDTEFGDSKKYLENLGIKVNGICYPWGHYNELTMKVARKYYNVGLSSDKGINDAPIKTYNVKRILIEENTLDEIKAIVDGLNGQWAILYSHSPNTDLAKFSDIIDYVQVKGIEIATVGKVMEVFQNKLDVGDQLNNSKYVKMGKDGSFSAYDVPTQYLGVSSGVKINTPVTYFQKYKISVASFVTSDATGIPFGNGIGTLFTHRLHDTDEMSFQEFHTFDQVTIVKRRWDITTKDWSTWEIFTNTVKNLGTASGVTNATPITFFDKLKISVVTLVAADASGIPFSNGIGTLETYRLTLDNTVSFQVFYAYDMSMVARRNWDGSTGTWKAWIPSSLVHDYSVSFDYLTNGDDARFLYYKYDYYRSITGSDPNLSYYPEGSAGIITMRRGESASNIWQDYTVRGSGRVYRRYWSVNVWTTWTPLFMPSPVTKVRLTTDPITSYVVGTREYAEIGATNPTIANYPTGGAGTLMTHRGLNDLYSYQEYRIRQSISVYARYWDTTNSTWTAFIKISAV